MTLLDARRARLALIEQVEGSNGQRYRALALYLQVLRDGLLKVVQQACFHLATQVYPQRYASLPQPQRRELHTRLRRLVHRCNSLLTVEQLAALAHQRAREQKERRRRRQHRLLQELQSPPMPQSTVGEAGTAADTELPSGSIRLDLALPLSAPLGPPLGPFPSALFSKGVREDSPPDGSAPGEAPETTADLSSRGAEGDAAQDEANRDLLSAIGELFEMSLQRTEAEAPAPGPDHTGEDPDPEDRYPEEPDTGPLAAAGPLDPFAPSGEFDTTTLWCQGRLPGDPLALQLWFDGIEAALARRLRNLSHAINVELLRLGLTQSLLPVSLLDAILQGQVDTLPAGANLVRLALPMPDPSGRGSLESIALLLRVADLEMELPALRTCRRSLQQWRQEDRRIAEQFRRLERRLQVLEAEALWLEDNRHDETGQQPRTGPLP